MLVVEGIIEFPKLLDCGLHKYFISAETSDCTNKQSMPASLSFVALPSGSRRPENHLSSCNTDALAVALPIPKLLP